MAQNELIRPDASALIEKMGEMDDDEIKKIIDMCPSQTPLYPNMPPEQIEQMKKIMNPQTLKMASQLLKNNPQLMSQIASRNGQNLNIQSSRSEDIIGQQGPVESDFCNQQQPQVDKSQILMILGMLRQNPKQFVQMAHQMTNMPILQRISNMSDRKLKMMMSVIYYVMFLFINIFTFVRQYKIQIILFVIAYMIYSFTIK